MLSPLEYGILVSRKMSSRRRLRVVESPEDDQEEHPDQFQYYIRVTDVPGRDATSHTFVSLPDKTETRYLPPGSLSNHPIELDSTPPTAREQSNTRYSFRSIPVPDQPLKFGADSLLDWDDDVVEIQRPFKRRRLNEETVLSGGGSAESPQIAPTKKIKKHRTSSTVVENPSNTVPASAGSPTRISLSKFASVPKPRDYPPPLPPINNKILERQCFTHRSHLSSMTDYERLEWLGDTYLNYCVARILYSRFPQSQEGQLTMFRSHLVRNKNIREYALMYGLPKRLLKGVNGVKNGVSEKMEADMFESYIGGLLIDRPETGEQVAFEWISKITEPQIDEFTKLRPGINRKAIRQLEALLDGESVAAPTYACLRGKKTDDEFEAACSVQGREIVNGAWSEVRKGTWKEVGRGIGSTEHEAKLRAAMHVLEQLSSSQPKRKTIFVETDEGEFEEVEVDE